MTVRVANVIEESRIGGPQKRIMSVACGLQPLGIKTLVYMADRDADDFQSQLNGAGIEWRSFPLVRLRPGALSLARYLVDCLPQVIRYIAAFRRDAIDVVHVNSAVQWRPAFAAWLCRVPCIWHLNDTGMPWPVRVWFSVIKRCASAFIVSGRRVESYYLPYGSGDRPLVLIHAPVDVAKCDRTQLLPGIAEKNASPSEGDSCTRTQPVRVINVGNVNPEKDIETFVIAASLVERRRPGAATFIQVGGQFSSQERYIKRVDDLAQRLHSGITFLGQRGDVLPILKSSQVYVHTARTEASGAAVWEAVACGLPVVTTDVADYSEMNERFQFARICPPGDAESLATAIIEIIDDPQKRAELAAQGRALVLAEIDVGIAISRHAELYRRIAIPVR